MSKLAVITRPNPAGNELQQSLQAAGINSLHLPGLAVRALTPQAEDKQAIQHADWWLFSSPAAIRHSARWLQSPVKQPRIAVLSSASARLLADVLGLPPKQLSVIWPADGHRSEHLLQHPELQRLQDQRIVIFNAPSGRQLLPQQLQARGAQVQELTVYQRVPAELAHTGLMLLSHWPDHILTLWTSNTAIRNLHEQLDPAQWQKLMHGDHLLLSNRQKAALETAGAGNMYLASAPDNASLQQQIISLCL